MRALSIDPGALRMGYAVIEADNDFELIESGIIGLERDPDEKYQDYKQRLLEFWILEFNSLFDNIIPDIVIAELVPAASSTQGFIGTQTELVKMVVTIGKVAANSRSIEWRDIAATTIKKKLTGSGKATKVGVRNAVIAQFPQLEKRKKELTETADESDAIGIGLVGLGFDCKKGKKYGTSSRTKRSA